ncbi:MAG: glycosyltransferase family 4 protein [Candidatus Pacebacteria bacterium]|nr:glycosyltransferase family 4 protein [Candidatus Paceibacterota bacterium]MCF7856933.1 glycosyltransferase family 4 protein [Candidatus Paceibacterota bacterium]
MKILIATGLYPPEIGGPATYAVFLEKFLGLHGVSCSVLPYSEVRKYPKAIRHLAYIIKLLLRSQGVTLFYALDTVSVGLPVRVVSFITRKPYFLRVPGDYAWEQGQQRFGITETLDEFLLSKKKTWKVTMLSRIQYYVALHATKVVVPSEYMKSVVSRWGIELKKITRVYSALTLDLSTETKTELRSRFEYDGFVVSTAGRLVPWKGMEVLIDVVAQLYKQGKKIRLEIMGDGELRSELERHVEKIGAQEYVHFYGVVDKRELKDRIKASDVFVLNTSYEGLSHQLLEVMDCGTPVITTPVGGNAELIEDGKEGLLVSFNDKEGIIEALTRVATDERLQEHIVGNAHEKVSLFREEVIIPEVVKLFT